MRFRTIHSPRMRSALRPGRRSGSATVEMAIMLPLLFTLVLLSCDLGRFCHRYIAVINAARAGAGYAAMNPVSAATKANWDAAIRSTVEAELTGNTWFNTALLTMPEPTNTPETLGMREVRVEVSYPFDTLINWPFLPGYNNTRNLRHVVVMRAIR